MFFHNVKGGKNAKEEMDFLALLLVIPGLMFSVSCQKKLVDASPEPMAKEEPKAEVVKEEAPVAYKAPGVDYAGRYLF